MSKARDQKAASLKRQRLLVLVVMLLEQAGVSLNNTF